ncbi:Protein phosphatase PTC7 homolog [Seminavis robusta]|uniref:Protein phosphatase n=1 Tax=Seminavis robusta TaxID=568900 RepID=A0A9N8E8L4_9STRA|nr:Protein phosphatase PTC7 homolog [Seminavis robusta]|eukprot:Sro774_g200650.1 Protein phosphatase PTC7 homolog (644) ;mRNA; r:23548-25711
MTTLFHASRVALKRARIPAARGYTLSNAYSYSIRLLSTSPSSFEEEQLDDRSVVIPATLASVTAKKNATTASHRETKISKKEMREEETKRWRLSDVPISDILKAKHSNRWVNPTISSTATLKEAIEITMEGELSAAMVTDESKHVVGLVTSRDLLRCISMGIKDGDSSEELLDRVVGDHVMTPISQVIYARPEETVGSCRTIMAKLGIKCLPVLSKEGRVEGLVTARDMSQYRFSAEDKGGKKSYLNDVSERVGMGSNTSMADPPAFMQAHLALEQTPLFINVGVAELPHPFKTENGVGMNHRDFGPSEFSSDPSFSEDAYFTKTVRLPDEKLNKIQEVTYCGVADGVGSWRAFGVDPREFSHALMKECEHVLQEASDSALEREMKGEKNRRSIRPGEVLANAYDRVVEQNITGSSTACVALFDSIRHQLHFSNLGDSGIIILRHIDSNVAGALKRNRKTPRAERKSDLQAVFVSQQQLHSFNHPFQLGWTGEELEKEEKTSFSSAKSACTTSVHLRRGDVIIMATDGLFDNVDIDEIAAVTLEWERQNGFLRGGDIDGRENRWTLGNSLTDCSYEKVPNLAEMLAKKARDNSLDPTTDSPFALLAKDNDIMWSGGMPDDCTVIAMHVVGRSPPARAGKLSGL